MHAEMQPASHFVGRWLRSRGRADQGFGYCKQKRGGLYVMSYVDIPEVLEHEVLVTAFDLVDKPIPKGTRVWVKGTPYGWHAGVIIRASSLGRYEVALVGVARQILLYEDQFYVRWSQPLHDPSMALQYGLSEAPTYHEARTDLLGVLVRQRQRSRGLSGIISAPVDLYHHQIDTVARVLADPVIRYLLADEVGLGKTIEAGLIIRQVMIDDPYCQGAGAGTKQFGRAVAQRTQKSASPRPSPGRSATGRPHPRTTSPEPGPRPVRPRGH